MRKNFVCLISSMAFLAGTIFALPSPAGPNASKPAAQKAPKEERGERAERHPEIRQAIRALERAKHHLESAAHDFGGHRARALQAVNEAIEQLRLAIRYDKD